MKNSKYDKMHEEIFCLCKMNGIHVVSGRVSCLEIKAATRYRAAKHFFISEHEFDRLVECLNGNLDKQIYTVKAARLKNGHRTLTVQRTDILATSFAQLMKYPKGSYHPIWTFRSFAFDGEFCNIFLNKEMKTVPAYFMKELQEFPYADGTLYIPQKVEDYFFALYGKHMEDDKKVSTYQIFDEYVKLDAFIEEAVKRNLINDQKRERDDLYRDWIVKERNPVMKSYRTYQKELLGTTLSPADSEIDEV